MASEKEMAVEIARLKSLLTATEADRDSWKTIAQDNASKINEFSERIRQFVESLE